MDYIPETGYIFSQPPWQIRKWTNWKIGEKGTHCNRPPIWKEKIYSIAEIRPQRSNFYLQEDPPRPGVFTFRSGEIGPKGKGKGGDVTPRRVGGGVYTQGFMQKKRNSRYRSRSSRKRKKRRRRSGSRIRGSKN